MPKKNAAAKRTPPPAPKKPTSAISRRSTPASAPQPPSPYKPPADAAAADESELLPTDTWSMEQVQKELPPCLVLAMCNRHSGQREIMRAVLRDQPMLESMRHQLMFETDEDPMKIRLRTAKFGLRMAEHHSIVADNFMMCGDTLRGASGAHKRDWINRLTGVEMHVKTSVGLLVKARRECAVGVEALRCYYLVHFDRACVEKKRAFAFFASVAAMEFGDALEAVFLQALALKTVAKGAINDVKDGVAAGRISLADKETMPDAVPGVLRAIGQVRDCMRGLDKLRTFALWNLNQAVWVVYKQAYHEGERVDVTECSVCDGPVEKFPWLCWNCEDCATGAFGMCGDCCDKQHCPGVCRRQLCPHCIKPENHACIYGG